MSSRSPDRGPTTDGDSALPGDAAFLPDDALSLRAALGASALGLGASAVGGLLSLGAFLLLATKMEPAQALRFSGWVMAGGATSWLLAAVGLHRRMAGRRGAVACLACLGWLPIVLMALAVRSNAFWVEGFGLDLPPNWAMLGGPLIALLSLGASAFAATLARHSRLDAALRRLALGALFVVAIPTAIASWRIHRPDPDAYLTTLPKVGVLDVDGSLSLGEDGPIRFERAGCLPPVAIPLGDDMTAPGCVTSEIASRCTVCQPLTVLHDPRTRFYWLVDGDGQPQIAFRAGDAATRRRVTVGDLRGAIAPPMAWTLDGVLGVAMGAMLLARAFRVGRDAVNRARAARLVALALTSVLLCGAPLLFGAILGRW